MNDTPPSSTGPLDDRLNDFDADRLRDAAAHYIDVVRAVVRLRLQSGVPPAIALDHGLGMLESWLETSGYLQFNPSADEVCELVRRLRDAVGPAETVEWFLTASDDLGGCTPVHSLVRHNLTAVERAVSALERQARQGAADQGRQ